MKEKKKAIRVGKGNWKYRFFGEKDLPGELFDGGYLEIRLEIPQIATLKQFVDDLNDPCIDLRWNYSIGRHSANGNAVGCAPAVLWIGGNYEREAELKFDVMRIDKKGDFLGKADFICSWEAAETRSGHRHPHPELFTYRVEYKTPKGDNRCIKGPLTKKKIEAFKEIIRRAKKVAARRFPKF